ncbi:MAG: MFS transporter [Flavobacteriales bacterium]|nr:MFS transporter [Flavobacteriales bacterium]MBK6945788.1 MFS transporter [Flavobacteriales bacterium]MBK7241888.1 MFS transporter [Flavobacteriales bacterium]MBK7298787.1 MFS transporter [Flavobacteriales bacterium]MBK9534661.1 MFS transporter [Flavobacteriales bacterium]
MSSTTITVPKGHPQGLYWLFAAEMWERFCYYGMRALLLLYLVESLAMGDNKGFAVYGAYTALVYVMPVIGGRIADQILGSRWAVLLGGILMAIGEFIIVGGTEMLLFWGMAVIIVGNGLFKPNISTMVGKLYEDGDPRKDSGFTIFYIGINLGALLATTVCAEVGNIYGAQYGFALAGIGMLLGVIIFQMGSKHYAHVSAPPSPETLTKPKYGPLSPFTAVVLGCLALIPVLYFLLRNTDIAGYMIVAVGVVVIGSLIMRGIKDGKVQLDKMFGFIILMLFNIVFWACFEQAGSSLTLFADRNVDRHIFGWEMGAATSQFFNPAYILLFGSIFSVMWLKLKERKLDPNIPMKFGLGILQLGLGYLVILIAAPLAVEYQVPLWTLALLYMLHTTGELFLSPIGLSMVTKLVPKDMTATAMGAWFLSIAGANYVAGLLATLTGAEHEPVEGEVIDKAASLFTYVDVYSNIGYVTVGLGLLLIVISPLVNKLFHGIR